MFQVVLWYDVLLLMKYLTSVTSLLWLRSSSAYIGYIPLHVEGLWSCMQKQISACTALLELDHQLRLMFSFCGIVLSVHDLFLKYPGLNSTSIYQPPRQQSARHSPTWLEPGPYEIPEAHLSYRWTYIVSPSHVQFIARLTRVVSKYYKICFKFHNLYELNIANSLSNIFLKILVFQLVIQLSKNSPFATVLLPQIFLITF